MTKSYSLRRTQLLEIAQENINEAVKYIRAAVRNTNIESKTERYIIGHLNNWANEETGIDQTIPKIIKALEKEYVE